LNTLRLNWIMSAGEMSPATRTSGSSPPKSGRRRAFLARQRGEYALGHLLQIRLALAQVLVLHFVELARQNLELRRQCPLGVVVTFSHPARRGTDKRLVVEQHQVHVEQGRQLRRGVAWQFVLQGDELARDLFAGTPQPRHLGPSLFRRDEVVRHVDPARRDQHRAPNGHAPGDGQSEDLQRHARAPLIRLRRTDR
jgi:hypothetical protein